MTLPIVISFLCFFQGINLLAKTPERFLIKSTNYYISFDKKIIDGLQLITRIKLKQKKSSNKQEFKVYDFKGISSKASTPFSLIDLNGDGFEDISLFLEAGSFYTSYLYLIYSKRDKKYKKLGTFPLLKKAKNTSLVFAEEKGLNGEIVEVYYRIKADKLEKIN